MVLGTCTIVPLNKTLTQTGGLHPQTGRMLCIHPHPAIAAPNAGTLVHYYEGGAEPPGPPNVLPLPASATGRMGRISLETLQLAARVRSSGSRLVLVSGTRYSTFVNRLPFLPRADAYVIENGGRVFYPKEAVSQGGEAKQADGNTESDSAGSSAVGDPALTGHPAAALTEDLKWREQMESVTGPAAQDVKDPTDREGPLWDLYRRAVAEGFEVDTNTYYTMLRIKVKTGNSKKRSRDAAEGGDGGEEEQGGEEEEEKGGEAAMKRLLDSLPPGLLVVTNFGMVDICPERSGKHNAAAYLAKEHFGISLEECASMGDDDNDIALVRTDRDRLDDSSAFSCRCRHLGHA